MWPAGHHAATYGCCGLGHQDLGEALSVGGSGAVVELQTVEVFEVERERALVARDLDRQGVLAPGGEAGRLERDERAVREPAGEDRDVVDGDLAVALGRGARTGPSLDPSSGRSFTIVSIVPEIARRRSDR